MAPRIPTYLLYAHRAGDPTEIWLHCETIAERARLHDFDIRPHRHRSHFQLLFLARGTAEISIGTRYVSFDAPLAVFVPARAVHSFHFSADVEGWVVTAFNEVIATLAQSSRSLQTFIRQQQVIKLDPDMPAARDFGRLIFRISIELAGQEYGRMVLLDALLRATIVNLARAGKLQDVSRQTGGPQAARFALLQELVEQNFRDHHGVDYYAAALQVSPAQLNRICRANAGLSLLALLHKRILDAALRELLFTTAPVKSIATGLGYADPTYFNRFFKSKIGMTPGEFRKVERDLLVGSLSSSAVPGFQ